MKFQDTLNTKLWDLETNDLQPEVKSKLEEIADAFIEYIEIPQDAILDMVITGSSASYNYNKYSDLDLHIIVDYDKVHEDCPLVNGYLNSLKKQFNDNHDITIHGVPVELYAEQKDQGTVHNGLYSLQTGWIDKPQKIEPTDNDAAVEAKFNEIKELVDKCDDSEEATELLEKIYNMRKAGLAEAGEFCTENLAFKKLRNEGCMDKLRQIKKEQIDKQLSLESYNEDFQKLSRNDFKIIKTENGYFKVDGGYDSRIGYIEPSKNIWKVDRALGNAIYKYNTKFIQEDRKALISKLHKLFKQAGIPKMKDMTTSIRGYRPITQNGYYIDIYRGDRTCFHIGTTGSKEEEWSNKIKEILNNEGVKYTGSVDYFTVDMEKQDNKNESIKEGFFVGNDKYIIVPVSYVGNDIRILDKKTGEFLKNENGDNLKFPTEEECANYIKSLKESIKEDYEDDDYEDDQEEMHKERYVVYFETQEGRQKYTIYHVYTDSTDDSYNELCDKRDNQLGMYNSYKELKDALKERAEKIAKQQGWTVKSIENLGEDDEYYRERNKWESIKEEYINSSSSIYIITEDDDLLPEMLETAKTCDSIYDFEKTEISHDCQLMTEINGQEFTAWDLEDLCDNIDYAFPNSYSQTYLDEWLIEGDKIRVGYILVESEDDEYEYDESFSSMHKELNKYMNESKENMLKTIADEVYAEIQKLYDNDKDLMEYVVVDYDIRKYNDGSNMYVIEVRNELSYEGMVSLAEKLDKVVQKYDRTAYFDQVDGGIMDAVLDLDKNEYLKESYNIEGMDSIEMEIVDFGADPYTGHRFELDGVAFYVEEGQTLESAVNECIEMEFMPEWEEQGLESYNVDSVQFDEYNGKGTAYVGLFWDEDFNESLNEELQYGVEYRNMHDGIHRLLVTDSKEKAEQILAYLKELENPDTTVYDDNEIMDNSIFTWDEINRLADDCFDVDYHDTEEGDGMYDGIYIINHSDIKPDIYESYKELSFKQIHEELDKYSIEDPEYTVLYRNKNTDEPLDPYEFDNYDDAKEYFDAMKRDCPVGYYVQLNKLNKEEDMYDDIANTFDESLNETKGSYRSFIKKYIDEHPECRDKKVNKVYFDIAKEWDKQDPKPEHSLYVFKDNAIDYIKSFLRDKKNENLDLTLTCLNKQLDKFLS